MDSHLMIIILTFKEFVLVSKLIAQINASLGLFGILYQPQPEHVLHLELETVLLDIQ